MNGESNRASPSLIVLNESSPLLMDSPAPPSPTAKRNQLGKEDAIISIVDESFDKDEEVVKEDNLPTEIHKTVIAGLVLAVCFFLNTLSLVLTHQRQPNRNTTGPLPDILLDNLPFPTYDDGLYIAEVMIMVSVASTIITVTLHRFRWIVYRRIFIFLGILYFIRAFTMYVTVFPEASYTYYCSPKFSPATALEIFLASFKVFFGGGLSINGEHTFCGDYMYSGHTVILVSAALIIQEYSPRVHWVWTLVHGFYWLMAIVGILLVLSSRGHYTIDILVAYYITTRLWWIYHTLANNREMWRTEANFLNRVIWFRAFEWMEAKVKGKVPHHYSIPFIQIYINFEEFPPKVVRPKEVSKYR